VTRVRLRHTPHDGEYELVDFAERWPATRNQSYVLRDDAGEVVSFEHYSVHDGPEEVEVRCDHCGQWVDHAGPVPGGGWRCYGGYGGDECGEAEGPISDNPGLGSL
jgi:hypothetical protein